MKKTGVPILAIKSTLLQMPLAFGDIQKMVVRYPARIYTYDGVTLLGVAFNDDEVVTIANSSTANTDIGVLAKSNIPMSFKITLDEEFVGTAPTFVAAQRAIQPAAGPVADFTMAGTGTATVAVDIASTSNSADLFISTYAWTRSSVGVFGNAAAKTTTITFASAGTYTVTLTVTDSYGQTATKTKTIVIS